MASLKLIAIVGISAFGSLISTAEITATSGSDVGNQGSCSPLCTAVGNVYKTEESRDTPGPCDNFYRYICHNRQPKDAGKEQNGDITEVTESALSKQLFRRIIGLLEDTQADQRALIEDEESPTAPNRDLASMAKHLYKVCIEDKKNSLNADVKIALLAMLKSFGIEKWPLRDRKGKKNLREILTGTGLRTLSTIAAVPDKEKSTHVLTVNVPRSRFGPYPSTWVSEERKTKINAYAELIRSVLDLFCEHEEISEGATEKPDSVQNIVKDILQVEKRLAQMIRDAGEDENPDTRTVKNWQEKFGKKFPFIDALKTDTEKAGVTIIDSTKITIRLVSYFDKLGDYLNQLSGKKLINYLGWSLIREVSDALTVSIRTKLNTFLRSILKPPIAVDLDSESCIKKFIGYEPLMYDGVANLYLKAFFNKTFMEQAYSIALNLNSSFYALIRSNAWMNESSREKSTKWIGDVLYHMGASEDLLDTKHVEREYNLVPVEGSKNLALLFFLYRNNTFLQNLKLTGTKYDPTKVWRKSPFGVRGTYVEHQTALEMPGAALQEPIFTLGGPASHNYGSAGSLAGEVMAQAFRDEGEGWDDERGDYQWTKKTKRAFKKELRCLQKEKRNEDESKEQGVGMQTPQRDKQQQFEDSHHEGVVAVKLRDHIGLRSSFYAFQQLVSKCLSQCQGDSDEWRQNQFKAFFASYALSRCGNDGADKAEHRVNFALGTFSKFSSVFGCGETQKMKKPDRCRIMGSPPDRDTSVTGST